MNIISIFHNSTFFAILSRVMENRIELYAANRPIILDHFRSYPPIFAKNYINIRYEIFRSIFHNST